ncbi:methylmalonyl-CoA epimerase [Halomarina oriensis]|uniref:Methylmalonyl-CoA epimerase n=1 Tax=Halomarina oriensis TaxID=671145 RepID=A0A6B0GSN2_9EURY|nr:methylmalonyl-CoA epimerase [Halomarina oriensis]MWG35643.1 methylmalonyl-CoA epimerase [Halomarina oriensis]
MQFHHAGIATTDADALASLFSTLFETRVVHEEMFGELYVRFLDVGNGYFELLEPTGEGTIQRYLDDNGSGIHHLALETQNMPRTLQRARDAGVELIDEEPRPGAWGHEVAFCHPASTGGVLVEFVAEH